MSIKTNTDELSEEMQEKINSDLTIKIENTKYGFGNQVNYIYPYELEENNDLYIPFSYGVEELNFTRPQREDNNTSNVRFEGNLRPDRLRLRKKLLMLCLKKEVC
jgi:hypothetical protein